jgi:hypothetical protein
MKNLSNLSKICYILGFLSVLFSIVINIYLKKDFGWQIVTIFWILNSFINELIIKKLEKIIE